MPLDTVAVTEGEVVASDGDVPAQPLETTVVMVSKPIQIANFFISQFYRERVGHSSGGEALGDE